MARAHRITAAAANAARWTAYHAAPDKWFWRRIDRSGGPTSCWPWKGRVMTTRGGYGRLVFHGRSIGAHRMALTLAVGEAPSDGLFACHSCDNPICCNPAHLWWGTPDDNSADCVAKGRKRGAASIINVPECVELRGQGWKYSALAARYGVNQTSIGKALARAQVASS